MSQENLFFKYFTQKVQQRELVIFFVKTMFYLNNNIIKKKLYSGAIAILAIVATMVGLSDYVKTNASDLLSANVEALTRGEITVHPICYDFDRVCYVIDDDLGYDEIPGVRP